MSLFLDGRTLEQKLKDAEELLKSHGYLVRGPLLGKSEVKTPAQLVLFFYDVMSKYNPERQFMFSNGPRDRGIAKRFIESRMSLGMEQERAILECCELIEVLFKYEDQIGINFAVTSMGVLGQDSMGWVTERLVQIREGLNREVNNDEEARWLQGIHDYQEDHISETRLVEARTALDKILERYGEEKAK